MNSVLSGLGCEILGSVIKEDDSIEAVRKMQQVFPLLYRFWSFFSINDFLKEGSVGIQVRQDVVGVCFLGCRIHVLLAKETTKFQCHSCSGPPIGSCVGCIGGERKIVVDLVKPIVSIVAVVVIG